MEPFDDPILGKVEWNTRFSQWFCRVVTSKNSTAEFTIEEGELGEMLPTAREVYEWLCQNECTLRDELAGRMVELANQWRQENEQEITAATFAERVELTGAGLDGNGGLCLSYLDGDMFGGHLIVVNVSAEREMGEPYLVG